jgi:hypothetical protein
MARQSKAEGHVTGQRPETTRVEGDNPGDPAVNTSPGDAPADTWDPNERISTLIPSGAEAAEAARSGLPVVAYVKVGEVGTAERDTSEDRFEEYEVQGQRIRRNMETGESVRI